MADLSAYVDFSVALDKSDPDNPLIKVTDTSTYPGNVDLYIEGVVSVTQPDGISVDGSFTDPDIYSSGGELTVAEKELRLDDDDTSLQNGVYSITYTVNCTGYDTTVLTKTFTLDYTAPTIIITNLKDVFTPDLSVVDGSIYSQAGFTTTTTTRAWSADISYVGSTVQTVTGTQLLFDMAYSSAYYDAHYAITLGVTVTYTMTGSYTWVSVIDFLEASAQMDAYAPPTLAELLESLNTMYTEIQAGTWCGSSNCGCESDLEVWTRAESLYQNIIENGQDGNTTGLDSKVDQLLKIFNCSGVLDREHTGDEITAYDWGTTQTFSLHPPIQFTVGSGAQYAPANAATSYINPTLAGNNNYLIFIQGEAAYFVEGTDFNYRVGGGFDLIDRSFVLGDRFTLSFYA